MLTSDFYFNLPEELIAQYPSEVRGNDKLMLLEKKSGNVFHYAMNDLPNLISENTLMIFNNSRVRHARMFAEKESTGRKQEFVFLSEYEISDKTEKDFSIWKVMVRNAKKQKPGMRYTFPENVTGTILPDEATERSELRLMQFDKKINEDYFEKNGHVPLPPYIKRTDNAEDSERYQTVYARETGSAACPTAGLHFTNEMLDRLRNAGIDMEWITLHVGLGTFLPVREKEIENHKMHEEVYTISPSVSKKINDAKASGKKILAVGTTSMRTLESASDENGIVASGTKSTNIFIYPGFRFRVVNALFTNFHTPESTLLMLVSAFAGRGCILHAYEEAVKARYKFFSYGDAMLIQ